MIAESFEWMDIAMTNVGRTGYGGNYQNTFGDLETKLRRLVAAFATVT